MGNCLFSKEKKIFNDSGPNDIRDKEETKYDIPHVVKLLYFISTYRTQVCWEKAKLMNQPCMLIRTVSHLL